MPWDAATQTEPERETRGEGEQAGGSGLPQEDPVGGEDRITGGSGEVRRKPSTS